MQLRSLSPISLLIIFLFCCIETNAWGFKCAATGTPWFTSFTRIEITPPVEGSSITTTKPYKDFATTEAVKFDKDTPTLFLVKSDLQPDDNEWIKFFEQATKRDKPFFPEKIWTSLISGQDVSVKKLHKISQSKPLYLIKNEKMTSKKILKKDGTSFFRLS